MKVLIVPALLLATFLLLPMLLTVIQFQPNVAKEIINNNYLRNQFLEALETTLIASFGAVGILLVLGVPLAYLLARRSFYGKEVLESMLDLPMMIPHSVVGIMIVLSYASGPLGSLLKELNVIILDNMLGTIAVMTFVGAPFLINAAKKGFESVPRSSELVARSLGADELTTFLKISLPMARRHVVTGAILAWARAVSEVGALLIVAYNPMTLSVLVYDWYNTLGLNYSLVIAIFMLLISSITFVIFRKVEGGNIDINT